MSVLVRTHTVWGLAEHCKEWPILYIKTEKFKSRLSIKTCTFFSDLGVGVAVVCGHLDCVYVIIVGSNMELETQHVVRQEHILHQSL